MQTGVLPVSLVLLISSVFAQYISSRWQRNYVLQFQVQWVFPQQGKSSVAAIRCGENNETQGAATCFIWLKRLWKLVSSLQIVSCEKNPLICMSQRKVSQLEKRHWQGSRILFPWHQILRSFSQASWLSIPRPETTIEVEPISLAADASLFWILLLANTE